jgi:hypothetical protein
MAFRRIRNAIGAVVVAAGLGFSGPSSAVPIELALVLDASGSISAAEWNLQRQGYANALAALLPGKLGQVAISVITFSTTSSIARGMTEINTQADVDALVLFFQSLGQSGGNTCISCGIFDAESTLTGTAGKSIIDVSTDGAWNVGVDPAGPAANVGTSAWAVDVGDADVVNALGIGILPDFAYGPGSFNMMAADFAAFETALIAKLGRELPEPTDLALLGIAMVALVFARRRSAA